MITQIHQLWLYCEKLRIQKSKYHFPLILEFALKIFNSTISVCWRSVTDLKCVYTVREAMTNRSSNSTVHSWEMDVLFVWNKDPSMWGRWCDNWCYGLVLSFNYLKSWVTYLNQLRVYRGLKLVTVPSHYLKVKCVP